MKREKFSSDWDSSWFPQDVPSELATYGNFRTCAVNTEEPHLF